MARRGFDIPTTIDIGAGVTVTVSSYRWPAGKAYLVLEVRLDLGDRPGILSVADWRTIISGLDLGGKNVTAVTPQSISDIEARLFVTLA